jgi:hypothetical protein
VSTQEAITLSCPRWYPDLSQRARPITRRKAQPALIAKHLENVVAASRAEVFRTLDVLVWTTGEFGQVVGALIKTGQIYEVPVHGCKGTYRVPKRALDTEGKGIVTHSEFDCRNRMQLVDGSLEFRMVDVLCTEQPPDLQRPLGDALLLVAKGMRIGTLSLAMQQANRDSDLVLLEQGLQVFHHRIQIYLAVALIH